MDSVSTLRDAADESRRKARAYHALAVQEERNANRFERVVRALTDAIAHTERKAVA